MSDLPLLIALLALAAGAWLWLDGLRARDAAVAAARSACQAEGVLFLDDTVALSALRLGRDANGRVRIQRAYAFEYSDSGNNRIKGSVVLLGREVILLNVGARDGNVTLLHQERLTK
jgi:hypothetical protein